MFEPFFKDFLFYFDGKKKELTHSFLIFSPFLNPYQSLLPIQLPCLSPKYLCSVGISSDYPYWALEQGGKPTTNHTKNTALDL